MGWEEPKLMDLSRGLCLVAGHIPAEAGVTLHSTWGWPLPPGWSSGSAPREQGKEHWASSPGGIHSMPEHGGTQRHTPGPCRELRIGPRHNKASR